LNFFHREVSAAANALILPGKSYELVSFAAQKPDATVFLPSGSETKPGMMKYQTNSFNYVIFSHMLLPLPLDKNVIKIVLHVFIFCFLG